MLTIRILAEMLLDLVSQPVFEMLSMTVLWLSKILLLNCLIESLMLS